MTTTILDRVAEKHASSARTSRRGSDRAPRNNSSRALLSHMSLPEIPCWLGDAEADQPGS